ncbi:E3 ubiquitin-protein ligase MPSR1-like [Typha angustifolia]|uniref:E3 ubiquitin-protein ligase MPSR1-like n=1 Tax=Typha angustifolia TaxID=59011 RepID=UPI003C300AEF
MSAAEDGLLEQLLREAGGGAARLSFSPIVFAAMGSPERIVLVNPLTQWTVVIQGDAGLLSALLSGVGAGTGGLPPASKASIEALKVVDIGEGEEAECAICLEGFGHECGVVKEMPCKHRFHGNCIEKWLGLHGSCPICRYEMPVEEGEGKKEVEGEGERRRGGVWVTISVGRRDEREGGEAEAEAGAESEAEGSRGGERTGF